MIHVDYWYGDTLKDVAFYDMTFYPNDGIYRGNIFNKDKEFIGDYYGNDSVQIEHVFKNGGNNNVEC